MTSNNTIANCDEWFNLISNNIKNNKSTIFFVNNKNRQTGKTTALIKISLLYDIPIIATPYQADNINNTLRQDMCSIIKDIKLPTATKLRYTLNKEIPRIAINPFNYCGLRLKNGALIEECYIKTFSNIVQNLEENSIAIRGGFCYTNI